MFELANLLWNVGMAAGKALGITLFALSDVNLPQQLHQVATIEMSSAAYVSIRVRPKTEEECCRYTGIIVPFEQLWEERTTNMFGIETVTPPQPGVLAGYAIIINRKDCEGRAAEPMFRVASMIGGGRQMSEGARFVVLQLSALSEAARPKWTQQVMDVLATQAETNPVAKEFMRFTEDSAKTAVVTKAE